MPFRTFLALLLVACGNDVSISKQRIDDDSDGYFQDADCDDHHATVHPDAAELCDGLDNDCDGTVDEDATDVSEWFLDEDGDGWGGDAVSSCEQPDGSTTKNGDCDDTNADISPDDVEHCDGVDEDCDGTVDNDAIDASLWYTDADADGYGAGLAGPACTGAAGQSANDGDCDDRDDRIHPNAPELDCTDPTDYNCDGSVGYADADADGTPACQDCDDADASAYPGATEVCDGADDDCDGTIDNGVLLSFYRDADADAFGDPGLTTEACSAPSGYSSDATDCDDADATIYPGAAEFCDGLDHDCDGLVLENSSVDTSLWYADSDGDSFGGGGGGVYACTAPAGHVADGSDCDDADAAIHPGAPESCDGVDQDCDGSIDNNAVDATFWYADADGDRFGNAARVQSACSQPTGYVADATDCDDGVNTVNPAAPEVCDAANTDEDCDGLTDDVDPGATGKSTWYVDSDSDGYGGTGTTSACDQPSGAYATTTDCNDSVAAINPAATELCDSATTDEDCDGLVNDADPSTTGKSTWYRDVDGDGYGGSTSTSACDQPSGTYATTTDCNDSVAAINPAATEVCDTANTDEDCDGLADDLDTTATGKSTWYRDVDGDGYAGSTSTSACDRPSGTYASTTDCNDSVAAINPAAAEICDTANTDEDCDGLVNDADPSTTGMTTWYRDLDGDGYGGSTSTTACTQPVGFTPSNTDCNDGVATINPTASEICDTGNTDEDCDGLTDDADSSATGKTTWYRDVDGDGHAGSTTVLLCDAVAGTYVNSTDCNDSSAAIYPGAAEICDAANTDEDCDGLADDADGGVTGKTTWYRDVDGDSYGGLSTTLACDRPSGYVATSTDCSDTIAAINPGAAEICDAANTDEDCDGLADDNDPSATGQSIWYIDQDGDGYWGTAVSRCEQPFDSSTTGTDCDDTSSFVNESATELCGDNIDQDCSGADLACAQWSGSNYADSDYATKIVGLSSIGGLGSGLAVGDFDGDGLGDLVVGDPDYLYSSAYGAAFGFYGQIPAGEWQATLYDDFLYYNSSSTYSNLYGSNMANIGDVTRDGLDDLVVFSGGTVSRLYYGGDTGTSTATSRADRSVTCNNSAALGDWSMTSVTLDWICADTSDTGNRGKLTIYSGTATSLQVLTGESNGDYAGYSLASGDIDGDGLDDMVVGAFGDDDLAAEAGAAYIVFASNTGATSLQNADVKIRGEAAADGLGTSVEVMNDLNGDGYGDVAVGAPSQDGTAPYAGAVYLITNPTTGGAASMAWATITGSVANTALGGYALEMGDYDANGLDDLAVSSILTNSSAGSVWVFYSVSSGSYTDADADVVWLGNHGGDYLGWRVATVPDTNNDSKDDLVATGINGDGLTGNEMGAVWLWLSP